MAEGNDQSSSYAFFKELINRWSMKKKIGLVFIFTVCIVLIFLLIQQYRFSDYRLLDGGLSRNDMAVVSQWLQLRNISYQIKGENLDIYIPADQLYAARIELAEHKIPSGNEQGYDLFAPNQLTFIDAVSETGYSIAAQRELSRTISALNHIESAHVHLNLSDSNSGLETNPSASVIIKMVPGRKLVSDQFQGITHLISAAVTGLPPSRIKIFDASGVLIKPDSPISNASVFSADSLSYQRTVEMNLELRAQEIIDAMIGKGQALVKVTAELDFSETETTSETFDPDEPVVKREYTEQQPNNSPLSSQSGLEYNADAGADEIPYYPPITTSSKIDYEINKTTRKTIKPVGTIEKLSASILLTQKKATDSNGADSYQQIRRRACRH